MSILPTFLADMIEEKKTTAAVMKIPKEYGVNFQTGQLTGRIVEGVEAVKVWIWNVLHTERYRHAIYSWDYGVEYEQYIGETLSGEFLQSDCQTETEEALLVNPYITGISDFSAAMEGSTLHISFTAETTLGNVEVDENV